MSDRRLVLLVLFAVAMWVGIESPGISAVEPPVGGANLIRNGTFERNLEGWMLTVDNAESEINLEKMREVWSSYSLTFNTKGFEQVSIMLEVCCDHPGGAVWFDNFRSAGLTLENPGFEQVQPGGYPTGWEILFPYSKSTIHPKNHIGVDFSQASEGQLSLRFTNTYIADAWKRAIGLKLPPGLENLRAITGDEMRAWQVVDVHPHTEYTVTLDYRISADFYGIIRPVVYGSNGEILADSGWMPGDFQDILDLSAIYGRARARMTFQRQGRAQLSQDLDVASDKYLELRADVYTSRPDQIVGTILCEDAATGRVLGRDEYSTGGRRTLKVRFTSASGKVRVRLIGAGRWGFVNFDNVELSAPEITPPVQQAVWKSADDSFPIGDSLAYHVTDGSATDIEGALWLVNHDLTRKGIRFVAGDAQAPVSISIGTFPDKGDEGYHLSVDRDGVHIAAATPRAAQHALMTFLQLVWAPQDAPDAYRVLAVDVTDWPDMPIRGAVMGTSYVHIMPEDEPGLVPFHDDMYFADLLQMVRWKLNFLMWRNRWVDLTPEQEKQTENLLKQCERFHVDVCGFISTLSDPPSSKLLVEHPACVEGVWIRDEKVTLRGEEPSPLANRNVLRNQSTDIVITSIDKQTTYQLGRDYIVQGQLGRYDPSNKRYVGDEPFTIARVHGSRIPDGATVLASYDCVGGDNGKLGPHVQYCPSDPLAVQYVGDIVERVAKRWHLKYLFIRGDELTRVNSDSRCRRRGLPPSQILLEHLDFIRRRIHQGWPETQIAMWEDAFSPYHGGYQWGFTEAGPVPPADIWQFVWYYSPFQALQQGWASLVHYQKFGLTTVVCPWFKLQNIREWAQVVGEARRRGWRCLGMVDTTWSEPPPYANIRETAIVSWKIPSKGDKRWVAFTLPEEE